MRSIIKFPIVFATTLLITVVRGCVVAWAGGVGGRGGEERVLYT